MINKDIHTLNIFQTPSIILIEVFTLYKTYLKLKLEVIRFLYHNVVIATIYNLTLQLSNEFEGFCVFILVNFFLCNLYIVGWTVGEILGGVVVPDLQVGQIIVGP